MTTPTLSHCLNLLLLRTSTHIQKNSNLNWFLRCKGFKNFAIWLAESIYSMPRYTWTKKIIFWYVDNILDYNSRTRFFQGCSFRRVLHLYVKITNYLIKLLTKTKKPDFPCIFGLFLPKKDFLWKSDSVIFILRSPNFMYNFRKILCAVLEKTWLLTNLHTNWPTAWQYWFHSFSLKGMGPKSPIICKKNLNVS